MGTPSVVATPTIGRRSRARAKIQELVQPSSTGLPSWKVLSAFPLLLLLVFIVLVAFGISGSSTGNWWPTFENGPDPSLIAGRPQAVRSDEWLVQSSWVISQVQQGFPLLNGTFPGGMDASVQNDLPVWDWSSLFRPHVIGFLLLPLDQGMAVRWWLPGLSLIAAAYVLFVTLMPRRPVASAVLAVVFFLSPLIQWWFLPTTIWPPTWAFLAIAAVIWSLRDPRRWVRIVFAVLVGYLAVTMALGIYAPFIVPSVLVFGFFFLALFLQAALPRTTSRAAAARTATTESVPPAPVPPAPVPAASVPAASTSAASGASGSGAETASVATVDDSRPPAHPPVDDPRPPAQPPAENLRAGSGAMLGWRGAAIRMIPLVVAGIGAAVVLALWVLTRRDTISALLGTVYPGQRLEATGALDFNGLIAILAGPFDESLKVGAGGILGPNSSEAAAPLLLGLFLLVPLLWISIRDWRVERYLHWTMIACIAATALVLLFLLIPGWDWLAHLILIDRTTVPRIRMALAILSVLSIVLLIRRLDRRDVVVPWSISWTATALAAGSLIVVWAVLRSSSDNGLVSSTHWRILAILFVAAVLLLTRRQVVLGLACLLVVAFVIGGNVNPWYRGVFDLNDTAIGQQIHQINDANPGTWVGIGGFAPTALLVQSGVQAYNGVQTYPPGLMWQQIDPTGQYANNWNRLAGVSWVPGVGEPVPEVPVRDQIQVTFDSCSDFAREHVTYVLTDKPLEQACLSDVTDVTEGPSEFHIYRVQP